MSKQKQHGEPCPCAEWERGRTESPSPSVHTHTAAGLPGWRQHGCHFVEEKKKHVSVQRAAGFPSNGGEWSPPRGVYTSFMYLWARHRGAYESDRGRERDLSFILIRFALFSSTPRSTNMARRQRLRRSWGARWVITNHLFCAISSSSTAQSMYQTRMSNVGYTLCSSAFQQKSEGGRVKSPDAKGSRSSDFYPVVTIRWANWSRKRWPVWRTFLFFKVGLVKIIAAGCCHFLFLFNAIIKSLSGVKSEYERVSPL